jgi:hypothetical protein
VLYSIIGKRGRGAEVALKEFKAKFQPKINTVQLQIKTNKTKEQLLNELSTLDKRQPTTVELGTRTINTSRLGKSLAKMAIEIVACTKPEIVLNPELDAVRNYALGRGKLKFLPFAVGVSKGVYGAELFLPDAVNHHSYAPVALIWIPASVYAIQLFDFDDLQPLRTVAQSKGLVFDENGKRSENAALNLNLEFPVTPP